MKIYESNKNLALTNKYTNHSKQFFDNTHKVL